MDAADTEVELFAYHEDPERVAAHVDTILEEQTAAIDEYRDLSKKWDLLVDEDPASAFWMRASEPSSSSTFVKQCVSWALPTSEFLEAMRGFLGGNGGSPTRPPVLLGIGSGHGYMEGIMRLTFTGFAEVIATDSLGHSVHRKEPYMQAMPVQALTGPDAVARYGSRATVLFISFPPVAATGDSAWAVEAVRMWRTNHGGKLLAVVMQLHDGYYWRTGDAALHAELASCWTRAGTVAVDMFDSEEDAGNVTCWMYTAVCE